MIRTTCPYCGVGCGVLARHESGETLIEGDPDHPANYGRLCSKGAALGQTTGSEGRLLHPEIEGRRVDWGVALDTVADTFSETVAEHGPDSVAFYVSGQILTEDYYVANKLMKGFIGSANIDTNSRLCMASSVAGHKRAFGSDTVPNTYEDIELADLVVIVGSNLAWCHPVLYQRLSAARRTRGTKVVLVDPRRTATADIADMHLAVEPDGDTAFFNGLLAYLAEHDAIDRDWIAAHTNGFDATLAAAREDEGNTGLDPGETETFHRLFAAHSRTVTIYSQGVNQSVGGTDKVNAILNCHLATGRIGKPGSGPFSVTGQPNAMGGREVGGLANQLAAHMDFVPADVDRASRFWNAPDMATKPGLKAVEMFDAVADGGIRAIWIMGTNPVDSLPDADGVKAALASCPFVVVSDVVRDNDTLPFAHVRLPSAAWGEKNGTVTNSERRISRQRAFMAPPGEARPDWWQMAQVARRMGFEGFDHDRPTAIFAEHARLSAFENDGSRDFDIGGWVRSDDAAYDAMQPFRWGSERFFAEGRFFTPDGKARFVAVSSPERRSMDPAFPFTLNTGRVRDHWHTMTRTGRAERLSAHLAEPFCEFHPADAMRLGLRDADLVRVYNSHGEVVVRALVTNRQREGSVFVPMHWTDIFASQGRIDALVSPRTDPVSGQPASKNVAVAVTPLRPAAYGFAVLRERPAKLDMPYWALARCVGGWRMEFALHDGQTFALPDPLAFASTDHEGNNRAAWFDGERLVGVVFTARQPVAVSRTWAVEQLTRTHDLRSRHLIGAGRPAADRPDRGAIVCSCCNVGANEIATAIVGGASNVDAVGRATQAGTNCGSCRSEINEMLSHAAATRIAAE